MFNLTKFSSFRTKETFFSYPNPNKLIFRNQLKKTQFREIVSLRRNRTKHRYISYARIAPLFLFRPQLRSHDFLQLSAISHTEYTGV